MFFRVLNIVLLCACVLTSCKAPRELTGSTPKMEAATYAHASEYLPWRIQKYVSGLNPSFIWTEDGNYFWYADDRGDTSRIIQITPSTQMTTELEHAPRGAQNASPLLKQINRSPTGAWGVVVSEGNLFAVSFPTQDKTQLTFDGISGYAYGVTPNSDLQSLTHYINGTELKPVGTWSPDGEKFLTYRVDERDDYELPYVISLEAGVEHQMPKVHFQKTAMPDANSIPFAELHILNVVEGTHTKLDTPGPIIAYADIPDDGLLWAADSQSVFTVHENRDFTKLQVYQTDIQTGKGKIVARDQAKLSLRHDVLDRGRVHVIGEGREIIFYSERDGWAHYYLYDSATGTLNNRITQGEWVVHNVEYIDIKNRVLYFTAGGKETGRDPYYSHLYSIDFDGNDLKILTPEDAHHEINFSPHGAYFIDVFSTVSTPPKSNLRRNDGELVMQIHEADTSDLDRLGWRSPVRFKVKADDEETDIYGTLFLPADLDVSQSYPILDVIYAGPQSIYAPLTFLDDRLFGIATAQLGFAVMVLDGRGTPLRHEEIQDYAFGRGFGDPLIVADHIAAMHQLAKQYPFIDVDRAGIYGISWGGYRAARAMMQFPDAYKAGVASAGSHDNALYIFEHDRWFGTSKNIPDTYKVQSNLPLAGQLKNHLLMIHGDVDDNVHIANTLQMADALMKANKDFDMLIYPGGNHYNFRQQGYFVKKHWDYFTKYLLGETPPHNVKIPDRK